ncbi:MAG TPA: hypothetical protein VGH65_10940 [Verrucomicrobiaceae bacterium]
MSQMHNPYAEERCKAVLVIPHRAAWMFGVLFMAVLWAPPLWEHLAQIAKGKWNETPAGRLLAWHPQKDKPWVDQLGEHLHTVEKSLDTAGYAVAMRQTVQDWLTRDAQQGNRKVHIGYNGMLFYQPDLRALTGYGPLKPEPFSVMKDPDLAKLPLAKDVVARFAAQLKERGVPLLLVPLPLKPMIYPELVTADTGMEWVTHPDAAAFYNLLRREGIDVLDLTADLAKLRNRRRHVFVRVPDPKDKTAVAQAEAQAKELTEAFLLQDTHWTPEAMRFAADRIAEHVRKTFPQAVQPRFKVIKAVDSVQRESLGDLVKLLDLKDPARSFSTEKVLLKVIGEGTEDRDSPIALLGDSFVNVFDDPSLGFANPARPEERVRSGLAQTLALCLQQPLDVIAMNGKGSTGVRKALAARPDDEVRSKKLVIWLLAARDLLLAKSAARDANIEWADVVFNSHRSSAAISGATPAESRVVIEATLVEKSRNQELNGSPYRDALHTALYDVNRVVEGTLDAKQVLGVQWTFKDKQMQPTASLATGQRYRLTLVPWDSKKELQSINLQDDSTAFDVARWFVEKAEPL